MSGLCEVSEVRFAMAIRCGRSLKDGGVKNFGEKRFVRIQKRVDMAENYGENAG
jgi:hypothetical protein